MVNIRAGIRNENMSLEAYVQNALGENEFIHGLQGTDLFNFIFCPVRGAREIRVSLPKPRAWGVRATYNF
jgi:hypothetical protein